MEYVAAVWNPISVRCINLLEKVQRRCTKICPLAKFPYPTRLAMLGLLSFKSRRDRGDLIQMFKYVTGRDKMEFVRPPKFLTRTRGNSYKFVSEHCTHNSRFHFFLNRI